MCPKTYEKLLNQTTTKTYVITLGVTTWQQVCPASSRRMIVTFNNQGSNIVFLYFGTQPSTPGHAIIQNGNNMLTVDVSNFGNLLKEPLWLYSSAALTVRLTTVEYLDGFFD